MSDKNYNATIVKISNLHLLEGLDRLQGTNIFGNQILVGKDVKIGDLGICFPVETQLSEEFCAGNDLIRRKDEQGKSAGGMFETSRRVKSVKFRGQQSSGFWIPVESLQFITTDSGKYPLENHSFNEFLGTHICNKYTPKSNSDPNNPKQGRKPKISRVIDGQFHFHFDTEQLGRNIHKITPQDLIVLTWKLHGTSAITSNCLVKKKLSLVEKFFNLFVSIKDTEYDYIYSSRRALKNDDFEKEHNSYYKFDIWTEAGNKYFGNKLHKGETVYYEIVGYLPTGGYIQGDFDYQCPPNEYKVYVYRITQTNTDGIVTELQWNQVKSRCIELGVETVPSIGFGFGFTLFQGNLFNEEPGKWNELFLEYLKKTYVDDRDCQFCKNIVPSEGICLRKEGANIEVFKLKNARFLNHETKQLDKEVIDIESQEAAS